MARALSPEQLRRSTPPEAVGFQTTAEAKPAPPIIGQARAMDAIRFGVSIDRKGYNLFALGPAGVGKHTLLLDFLRDRAAGEPVPPDLCYVYHFARPHEPKALRLPPGLGTALKADMERLVQELRPALAAALESDEFRARSRVIEQAFKERQEQAYNTLREQAAARGLGMLSTPMGVAFAPRKDNEVLPPDEFQKLPDEERERLQHDIAELEEALRDVLQLLPRWEREGREEIRALAREASTFAVAGVMEDERQRYAAYPEVIAYLQAVQEDVVDNLTEFVPSRARPDEPPPRSEFVEGDGPPFFRRYRVNVLVDHSASTGAPVVYEDNPTLPSLVGRVEFLSQLGALVTDFNLIKPGALHRADGGYLVLDANRLLTQPFAWEALKRTLHAHQVRIESVGQQLAAVSTSSLEPEPTPLMVKVALIGERQLYYLLAGADPDFGELFKVAADFDDDTDRSAENTAALARVLAAIVNREGLRPFDAAAVAAVIDVCSRAAEDAEKLTTRLHLAADLLTEADHWAAQRGADRVAAEDVLQAVAAAEGRLSRLRDRMRDAILRDTILVATSGEAVGQVNGLSVLAMGQAVFGQPSRITARVWLGKGGVVDIEREVNLGGPLHSKGVLILAGFLSGRFARDEPLALGASLVFEQSYGGVEGDSASAAELYALLSAIAEVPIRQSVAITGSVNQRGEVQPIGGVNEKIEGFFDVCRDRGLRGDEGVIIPAPNVKHLMLRPDVVEAVAAGRFQVWAIDTIDDGVPLLMGIAAGEPGPDGGFPADSLNGRVAARLVSLARRQRELGLSADGSGAHRIAHGAPEGPTNGGADE